MTDHPGDPVGRWLWQFAATHPGARVLDVGGGSGARAVPLAQAGCTVLVVDSSTDALASLARRAADAGVSERVSALQADADQLAAVLQPECADLVLYHHVGQAVDDPVRSLATAATMLRRGGVLSVLVSGRLSGVLGEALAGRPERALAVLDGTAAQDRRYDVPSLRLLLEQAGLAVGSITGIGVAGTLAGYAGRAVDPDDPVADELERRLGRHPVLGQLAGDLHAIGTRPTS